MNESVIPLGGVYTARRVPDGTYRSACAALEDRIFGGNWLYDFGPPVKSPPPLGETFTWGLYHGPDLIGWSHAQQRDERTVDMADTGLLPDHQGQGLYTRLLPHLLATFQQAGYTLVTSCHRATNNRVIIPKLRAGFVIQGLNLYEGGLNTALTLSLDAAYREAQHVRSGLQQGRGEAARRLGLPPAPPPAAVPAGPVPLPPGLDAAGGQDLGGGYTLHRVPFGTYLDVYSRLEDAAYDSVVFQWLQEARHAAPDVPRWTWLIAHAGGVAGWHYSRGWDRRTAYMVNTALLPAHRGAGVYSRLLPVLLETLRGEGYDLIRSHHHATNNAVLIPKLRAGFRMQGLEVNEHGVMAVLIYAFEDLYRAYMDARSGLTRPQGDLARRLGLNAPGGPVAGAESSGG